MEKSIKSTSVIIILWNRNNEALLLANVLEEALPAIEVEYERIRIDVDGTQHFRVKQTESQKLAPNWLFMGQGEGTA